MTTTTTAKAIALATLMVATSLTVAPAATAVSTDCDDDFLIPDSEPVTPQTLSGSGAEVGLEDVSASDNTENVTIRLESSKDKLEFGVFYLDDNDDCVEASADNLSNCGSSETLDSTGTPAPIDKTCRIDGPVSGTTEYFFHVVNLQSDPLDYKIWMSD